MKSVPAKRRIDDICYEHLVFFQAASCQDIAHTHYNNAADSVRKYYEALKKLKTDADVGNDVTFNKDTQSYESAGAFPEIAKILNENKAAVDALEQSESKLGVTDKQWADLQRLKANEVSKLNQAIDASNESVRKSNVDSVDEMSNTINDMQALLNNNQNASGLDSYKRVKEQLDILRNAIVDADGETREFDETLKILGGDAAKALSNAKDAMAALRSEMAAAGQSGNTTTVSMQKLLAQMNESIKANESNPNASKADEYKNLIAAATTLADALDAVQTQGKLTGDVLDGSGKTAAQAFQEAKVALDEFKIAAEGITDPAVEFKTQIEQLEEIIARTDKEIANWTKAKHGVTKGDYDTIVNANATFKKMLDNIIGGNSAIDDFGSNFGGLSDAVSKSETNIKRFNENTQSAIGHMGSLAGKFSSWLGVSQTVMKAVQAVKKMVSSVVELDTAMTELKKVTDATDATYERFLENAASKAKEIGSTLTDLVSATSSFARLGYSVGDASELAEVATIYLNVADGISDISDASDSLISTMQAFGIAASDAMTIVDKFNEVGNNFAISSAGVGEALQRSAAAMYAANNTLDETIALATAANTIVQDPQSVGRCLPSDTVMRRKLVGICVKII